MPFPSSEIRTVKLIPVMLGGAEGWRGSLLAETHCQQAVLGYVWRSG